MAPAQAKAKLTAAVQEAKASGLPWAQILAIIIQILSGLVPKPTAAAAKAATCERDACGDFCCAAADAIKAVHAEDYDGAGAFVWGQAEALVKMHAPDA